MKILDFPKKRYTSLGWPQKLKDATKETQKPNRKVKKRKKSNKTGKGKDSIQKGALGQEKEKERERMPYSKEP